MESQSDRARKSPEGGRDRHPHTDEVMRPLAPDYLPEARGDRCRRGSRTQASVCRRIQEEQPHLTLTQHFTVYEVGLDTRAGK